MKKNIMMRLSALLLVAVLLTTCVISGTFAKYTTNGSGSDSAKVAAWGVEVTAVVPNNNEYQATALTATETAVSTAGDVKLLAPGSGVKFAYIGLAGTPEVAVEVTYAATLTFTGWEYNSAEYMPLVFKVGDQTFKVGDDGIADAAALAAKVEAAIEAYTDQHAAGTNLAGEAANLAISCYWAYAGNDAADTALGNLAAEGNAPTVSLAVSCTVNQLDEYTGA